MKPKETIEAFDRFLASRDIRLEAVVIGGTALALQGVISRETRDCDVLHPSLSKDVTNAAREFAQSLRHGGLVLDDQWLNEGPASLTKALPAGWLERTMLLFQGQAITLNTLGREDLLMSKLFALCDRGTDLADCIALAPTMQEMERITPWLAEQDGNAGWAGHVADVLTDLQRRLSHEL